MTIEFRCGQCNQLLRVPDHSAGKNARCPKCQALMQVPAPADAPAPFGAPPPPLPGSGAARQPASAPALPPPLVPPPPPPKSDDPFAFLKQQDAPPPPAKPAGSNPFGEGLGPPPPPAFGSPAYAPAPGVNSYATPAGGIAGAYGGAAVYGPRTGLPWEVRRQNFSSWWDTLSLIIGSPSIAFSRMRQTGGLGGPIMYAVWGMGVPVALMLCILIPLAILLGIGIGQEGGAGAGIGFGAGMIGAIVVGAIFYVLFAATIGALIGAAIYHLCLLMVGGARQPFETTFRVLSFTQGTMMPVGLALSFIPYIGPLVQAVWTIVLLIIGLARAHEIPTGKAALAVLLPFGVMMVCCFGFVFLSVLGGMANN